MKNGLATCFWVPKDQTEPRWLLLKTVATNSLALACDLATLCVCVCSCLLIQFCKVTPLPLEVLAWDTPFCCPQSSDTRSKDSESIRIARKPSLHLHLGSAGHSIISSSCALGSHRLSACVRCRLVHTRSISNTCLPCFGLVSKPVMWNFDRRCPSPMFSLQHPEDLSLAFLSRSFA